MLTKIKKWISDVELLLEGLWSRSSGYPTLLLALAVLCGGYLGRPGEPPSWAFWEDSMYYRFARGEI